MTDPRRAHRKRIEEEAALWIVRLEEGDLSTAQKLALREWRARSPYHEQELTTLAGFRDDLAEFLHPQQVQTAPVGALMQGSGTHRARLRLVASLLAGVVISVLLYDQWGQFSHPTNPLVATYQTEIGRQKNIVLPDGSTVHLNTNSKIIFDYSQQTRTIHFVAGEALFSVQPDAKRPFVVLANGGVVRAVGTVFSVRISKQNIDVLVSEGRVALETTIQPKSTNHCEVTDPFEARPLMNLDAGQMASFSDRIETVTNMSAEKINAKLAWRSEMLIFDDERLQDVIREISRYTKQEIIVPDEVLRDLKISGVFPIGETTAFLWTLQDAFGISVQMSDENKVYLYSSPTLTPE